MKKLIRTIAIGISATLMATGAFATPVPVDVGNVNSAFATIGLTGYDPLADQENNAYWMGGSSQGSVTGFIMWDFNNSWAGNPFGIYSMSDPSKMVTLFDSSDVTSLTIWFDSDINGNYLKDSILVDKKGAGIDTAVADFGSTFGFFIVGGGTYYSDPAKNANDPNWYTRDDYMVMYQGNNSSTVNGNTFLTNEWLVFAEGYNFSNCFTDAVVLIESIKPIPEPATLALLGGGLIALGIVRRRKAASA